MSSATMQMDCPVCPRRDIPAESMACPTCGVNLTPLRRVRAIGEAMRARPWRSRAGMVVLAIVAGLAGIAGATAAIVFSRNSPVRSNEVVNAVTPPTTPRASPEQAAAPADPGLGDLAAAVDRIEGVAVSAGPGSLTLGLDPILFRPGSATLSPAAKRVLTRVATSLQQSTTAAEVQIFGHTDASRIKPGRRWRDNWSLGLARAGAAAGHLRRALQHNRIDLSVSSGDGNRERLQALGYAVDSRTVVLVVRAPRGQTSR